MESGIPNYYMTIVIRRACFDVMVWVGNGSESRRRPASGIQRLYPTEQRSRGRGNRPPDQPLTGQRPRGYYYQ